MKRRVIFLLDDKTLAVLEQRAIAARMSLSAFLVSKALDEPVICSGSYDDGIADGNLTRCAHQAGCGLPGCPVRAPR